VTYRLFLFATTLTSDLARQLSLLRPNNLGVVDGSAGVLLDAIYHVAHLDAMSSRQVRV
jgi:hypothetical protein